MKSLRLAVQEGLTVHADVAADASIERVRILSPVQEVGGQTPRVIGGAGSSDIVRILTKPTIRVTTTRPLFERLKEAPHRVATELRELAKDQDAVMGECSRMSLEGAGAESRHRITHAG